MSILCVRTRYLYQFCVARLRGNKVALGGRSSSFAIWYATFGPFQEGSWSSLAPVSSIRDQITNTRGSHVAHSNPTKPSAANILHLQDITYSIGNSKRHISQALVILILLYGLPSHSQVLSLRFQVIELHAYSGLLVQMLTKVRQLGNTNTVPFFICPVMLVGCWKLQAFTRLSSYVGARILNAFSILQLANASMCPDLWYD